MQSVMWCGGAAKDMVDESSRRHLGRGMRMNELGLEEHAICDLRSTSQTRAYCITHIVSQLTPTYINTVNILSIEQE